MIVKIRRGIGAPGKLWTGDVPEEGKILNARIVQKTCTECRASTRRLRVEEIPDPAVIAGYCEIPTLLVTMGGAGWVAANEEKTLQLWNWSGRVGGHAILNPISVLSGYWSWKDLPDPSKCQAQWVRTYAGNTLSEFALLDIGNDGSKDGGGVCHPRHDLPITRLNGVCPLCRKKKEVKETPEGLLVKKEEIVAALNGDEALSTEVLGKLVEVKSGYFDGRKVIEVAHDQYTLEYMPGVRDLIFAIRAAKTRLILEERRVV